MSGNGRGLISFLKETLENVENYGMDKFLEALLWGMSEGFRISEDYRESIKNFNGTIVIRTKKESDHIAATAKFADAVMHVIKEEVSERNVCVTFKNREALTSFLKSGSSDVLTPMLENTVQIEGNDNYFYRFGFLARDLLRRTELDHLLPKPKEPD